MHRILVIELIINNLIFLQNLIIQLRKATQLFIKLREVNFVFIFSIKNDSYKRFKNS